MIHDPPSENPEPTPPSPTTAATATATPVTPSLEMPISSKRRTPVHLTSSSSAHNLPFPAVMSTVGHDAAPALKAPTYAAEDHRAAVNRRRRFILYTLAFATMLALSSVLDVRRASLRNRHAKLQLTLPSSSLSSLSDSPDNAPTSADPVAAPASLAHVPDPNAPAAAPHIHAPANPLALPPNGVAADAQGAAPPAVAEKPLDAPKRDVYLSDQELHDGVDQLIAQVDQETSASSANATASSGAILAAGAAVSPPSPVDPAVIPNPPKLAAVDPMSTAANATAAGDALPLNAEDHFNGAVKRMKEVLVDEHAKQLVDENDLRTLQALELQATRGDCELKSGSTSGSLFKTDAEAASSVDIERTHPLWGAWCLFMGAYKTEAMRDYVTKQKVMEQKVATEQQLIADNGNATAIEPANAQFDPSAASLDDVMTPEQQSALRKQTELVTAHLQANDMRFLVALSLQATFGDCGPYGRESVVEPKDGEEHMELRNLREPLLEQVVTRKQGALWGAWCVMQGKKRTAAAGDLTKRLDELVDQLARSQASVQSEQVVGAPAAPEPAVKEASANEAHIPPLAR